MKRKVGYLMKSFYNDDEFNRLIESIISNKEYQKTKNCLHHGTNRYSHMIRVSYYSYKITKFCHLDYKSTARAAVLHDFFLDDYQAKEEKRTKILFAHPVIALNNAKKYFDLSSKEEDIIKSHMFPIGKSVPKYLESWIVNFVDDFSCFYERGYIFKEQMSMACSMIAFLFLVLFKRW